MKTRIIEATTGPVGNWGKFLVGQFDSTEMAVVSAIAPEYGSILRQRGWWNAADYFLMLDIETGEGAVFRHGGLAEADLDKHRVWVCPLFSPTLQRLYQFAPFDLDTLPSVIELDFEEAPFAMAAPRRPGHSARNGDANP